MKFNGYSASDIIIPEYDHKVYNINKKHEEYGTCMRHGDFLEILQTEELKTMSLIYADFTGHYTTFIKPFLEYIEIHNKQIRSGTIIGFTWSNNGAGTRRDRSKIDIDIGKFTNNNGYNEIDDGDGIIYDRGYGAGGCMNVNFLIKS